MINKKNSFYQMTVVFMLIIKGKYKPHLYMELHTGLQFLFHIILSLCIPSVSVYGRKQYSLFSAGFESFLTFRVCSGKYVYVGYITSENIFVTALRT